MICIVCFFRREFEEGRIAPWLFFLLVAVVMFVYLSANGKLNG